MWDWVDTSIAGKNYFFDFTSKVDTTLNGLNAALYTIKYITENYPAPYTLYLSGGVDSQAMLYAWHKSKIPFSTFSAVYEKDFNQHDLIYLKEFSEKYKIKINYVPFSLIEFLENEHDYYANTYMCGSPQITTFMKLVEMTTEGTKIMAGNFIQGGGLTGLPDHNNMGLYHYVKKKDNNYIPFFFLETPELAHAFKNTVTLPNFTPYENKVFLYQYHKFPVLKQENKLNGFEKIKVYYDTTPTRMPTPEEKVTLASGKISTRNFDLLYRNKYESKFSNYKYNFIC